MIEKFCLKCNKVFKGKRSSLKFCSKDCYILYRLEYGWNQKPEMIKTINTMGISRNKLKVRIAPSEKNNTLNYRGLLKSRID